MTATRERWSGLRCDGDEGEKQRRESDEETREGERLSCDSATATRERGRDERSRDEWGLRVIEKGFQSEAKSDFWERVLERCRIRGKKRLEWRRLRAETRKPSEPSEPIMVHRTRRSDRGPDSSMLFLHGMVPYLNRTVKLNGSRVSWSDRTVRSEFNNLGCN